MFSQVHACYRGSRSGKIKCNASTKYLLDELAPFSDGGCLLCASLESGSVLIF